MLAPYIADAFQWWMDLNAGSPLHPAALALTFGMGLVLWFIAIVGGIGFAIIGGGCFLYETIGSNGRRVAKWAILIGILIGLVALVITVGQRDGILGLTGMLIVSPVFIVGLAKLYHWFSKKPAAQAN